MTSFSASSIKPDAKISVTPAGGNGEDQLHAPLIQRPLSAQERYAFAAEIVLSNLRAANKNVPGAVYPPLDVIAGWVATAMTIREEDVAINALRRLSPTERKVLALD
jgi:hypothetical protein